MVGNEILEVFDLEGESKGTMTRSDYYKKVRDAIARGEEIDLQVASIRALVINPAGRLLLQRRAHDKDPNAGLYDKSIGGHVLQGQSWDLTLVKEAAEELGIPAMTLPRKQYEVGVHQIALDTIGAFTRLGILNNYPSVRVRSDGTSFVQPFKSAMYIGRYNGSFRFTDGESSGLEVVTLHELDDEIAKNPNKFTEDLKDMLKRYRRYIKPLKK